MAEPNADDEVQEHQFWSSSNVESARWRKEDGVVEVLFRKGATYTGEIDERTWEDFKIAPSPGLFAQSLGLTPA